MAAIAGALLGGAFLEQLSALSLAAASSCSSGGRRGVRVRAGRGSPVCSGWVAGTARGDWGCGGAAVVVGVRGVAAPWGRALHQIQPMRRSAGLAETGHTSFFLGRVTKTPGPLYYVVSTPLADDAVVPLSRRPSPSPSPAGDGFACGALAIMTALAFRHHLAGPKQFDRYAIVVMPFIALAVGLGVGVLLALGHGGCCSRPGRGGPADVGGDRHGHRLRPPSPLGGSPTSTPCSAVEQPAKTPSCSDGKGSNAGKAIRARRGRPLRRRHDRPLRHHPLVNAFPCGTRVARPRRRYRGALDVNERQRMDYSASGGGRRAAPRAAWLT